MTRRALALAVMLSISATCLGAAASADAPEPAFAPRPGAALPLALPLRDESGRSVALGDYFTGLPVVLVLEYLQCRTLCGLTLANVVAALQDPATAAAGYPLLAVSIDPRDRPADAAAAKRHYLDPYKQADAVRFHFLTGAAPALRALADAIGFRYRYDADLDQYSHPAGFVLATPDGRISRYLFDVASDNAAGLAAGLAAAAAGEAPAAAPGPLTRLLLLCRGGSLPSGRYSGPLEATFALANIGATIGAIVLFARLRRQRRG